MSSQTQISFECTPADSSFVRKIVDRAIALELASKHDRLGVTMDMVATHANGCPMDFERLLAADDFNFIHDVKGIERHIDRATGHLGGFFLPRFARPEAARAA